MTSRPLRGPENEPVRWSGTLPPIPAAYVDPVVADLAMLLWVRHGTLTVGREGGQDLHARSGQAIWVPPGLRHTNVTSPGSVVLPVALDVAGGREQLPDATVIAVPADWADWLAYRMARSLGFAAGAEPDRSRALDLLAGLGAADVSRTPRLPPMPASTAACDVVDRLLREPSTTVGLDEFARRAALSPRTLQRRLREETGHGFAQWRTAVRVHAAAAHLARGSDLAWTAHHVGYASAGGFSHAFVRHVGLSPGRYARLCRQQRAEDPLSGLVAGGGTACPAPAPDAGPGPGPEAPAIPGDEPTTWVAPVDGVRWIYRGRATVEIGGARHELRAGDIFWTGQGVAFTLEIAPGSVVLPLGVRSDAQPTRAALRAVRMPQRDDVELFLLHIAVANHFLLRPRGHDPRAFLDVLRPEYVVPETLPSDVETVVDALVRDPADRRGLAEWAQELSCDGAQLRRDFAEAIGDTYPRWRANVRMSAARHLMWDGHAPSTVARRLGYRHLSAFSRAFTSVHGVSPREWLRRSED